MSAKQAKYTERDESRLTTVSTKGITTMPASSSFTSGSTTHKLDLSRIFGEQDYLETSFCDLDFMGTNYTTLTDSKSEDFAIFDDSLESIYEEPDSALLENASTFATSLSSKQSYSSSRRNLSLQSLNTSPLSSVQSGSLNKINKKRTPSISEGSPKTQNQQLNSTPPSSPLVRIKKKKSYGSLIPNSGALSGKRGSSVNQFPTATSQAPSAVLTSSKKKPQLQQYLGGAEVQSPRRRVTRSVSHNFERAPMLSENTNSDDEDCDEGRPVTPISTPPGSPFQQQRRRSRCMVLSEEDATPRSPGRRCAPRHLELIPTKSAMKPVSSTANKPICPPQKTLPQVQRHRSMSTGKMTNKLPVGFYSKQDLLRREMVQKTPSSHIPRPKMRSSSLRPLYAKPKNTQSLPSEKKKVVWATTLEW